MQIKIIKKIFSNQIFRFLVVGGLAFTTEYIIFFILVNYCNNILNIYNLAHTISMICGACVSFVINKLWAFRSKKNTILQSVKYAIVFISNLGITNMLISIIIKYKIINNLFIIKVLLVLLTTTWNYFLYKYFVYKNREE